VRLIGGSHRGRILEFPDAEGLRPTADRIRETLFNWLAPGIAGASCLDLFAGTGALGFEAASRGATRVVMLESNPKVLAALEQNRNKIGLEAVQLVLGDGLGWLSTSDQRFDLVFLDPPFHTDLLQQSLDCLAQGRHLKPKALVYLELDARQPWPALPQGLSWHRQKTAGQVRYGLALAAVD
jgi:16S rRNA (guanine966-N2)-methyltransferase